MLTCEIMADDDRSAWQDFWAIHPQCGIYHHSAWKDIIETAYGHHAPYLVARTSGVVSGVLPLVAVRSRLFGRSLTSLPFLDFSGVVADDEPSHSALLAKAEEIGRQLGVDYVEIRQVEPIAGSHQTATHKVLMTLALAADADTMWAKLSSERRNRVRRAQKAGLTVDVGGSDMLSEFYDIWTRNMRDLGSPPHNRLFFAKILEHFGEQSSILLVRHEGMYIGAALALHDKGTMTVPWVSSLREHFQLYPNNVLYWEAIRLAIDKGLTTFDFGRSTHGSGTFEFKQRWGAVATPLHWHFIGIRRSPPEPAEESAKFRLAVRCWKHLPLSLTRLIGPALRRSITA